MCRSGGQRTGLGRAPEGVGRARPWLDGHTAATSLGVGESVGREYLDASHPFTEPEIEPNAVVGVRQLDDGASTLVGAKVGVRVVDVLLADTAGSAKVHR